MPLRNPDSPIQLETSSKWLLIHRWWLTFWDASWFVSHSTLFQSFCELSLSLNCLIWYSNAGKFDWKGQQIAEIGRVVNRIAQHDGQKFLRQGHLKATKAMDPHIWNNIVEVLGPFSFEGFGQACKSCFLLGVTARRCPSKKGDAFNPLISLQLPW